MLGTANYELLTYIFEQYDIALFVQPVIWYPLVIFVVQTIIYFGFVLLIDNLKFNLRDRQQISSSEQVFNKSDDLKK